MKKDKKWLKKEVSENVLNYPVYYDELVTTLAEVRRTIDETYKEMNEKPVIPKYVAEQLEYWERNKMNILWQFWLKEIPSSMMWWLEGEQGNYDKLFDAAKNGYEVEKEKMYYVYDSTTDSYLGFNSDRTNLGWYYYTVNKESFTEDEIKSIDERYWAFAQEATQ